MLDVEAVGQLVKGADECSMLKLLHSLLKELMNEADDGFKNDGSMIQY